MFYHVRGRLYCGYCVLRSHGQRERDGAVTLKVDGLECERCARFGYPALPPKALEILRSTKPSGSRTTAIMTGDGTMILRGLNAEPVLQSYGFKKSDVIEAQRRLLEIGIRLDADVVGSLLCREQSLLEQVAR